MRLAEKKKPCGDKAHAELLMLPRTAPGAQTTLLPESEKTLGDHWLTPVCSGCASTQANDVLMQIAKAMDGNYQGSDYFSLP